MGEKMNIDKIRKLLELLETSEIEELEIEIKDESGEIKLRKGTPEGVSSIYNNIAPPAIGTAYTPPPAPAPTVSGEVSETEEGEDTSGLIEITSPIVGTFYRAPSPDAEPYTAVGKHIEAGQVVCIVEAMKLMNEIQSEVSGTVEKILVENEQPVEFGQVLFLINPD